MAHNGAENLKGRVAASCRYRMVKHWFAEFVAAKQIREVRIGRAFADTIRAVCTGALHAAPSKTQQAGQFFVANDDGATFARSGAGMGAACRDEDYDAGVVGDCDCGAWWQLWWLQCVVVMTTAML